MAITKLLVDVGSGVSVFAPEYTSLLEQPIGCSKIAEAEAVVSVNEKKWLVMHVQLRLDELRGPQTLGSL